MRFTGEVRKLMALTGILGVGAAGLSGCSISLDMSGPSLSPAAKSKMEKIMEPAAVWSGRRIFDFYKQHPLSGAVIKDDQKPNGFEVGITTTVDGTTYDVNADMQKVNGKLDPSTTYDVSIQSDYMDGKIDDTESAEISFQETPIYDSRQVWFGDVYVDELNSKGKSVLPKTLTDSTYSDTHIDNPDNKQQVGAAVNFAHFAAGEVKRLTIASMPGN